VRLQLMFFGHMPRTDMLPYHRYDTPKSMGVPRVDLLLVSKVVELGVQMVGYRS
jgi:Methionine biosynthesis protein MetW